MSARSSRYLYGSQYYTAHAILSHRPSPNGLEYKVDWEPDPETGEKYEPSWEPHAFVSRVLIRAYTGAGEAMPEPIPFRDDVRPYIMMTRQSICKSLTKAATACRPRVHELEFRELSGPGCVATFFEQMCKPWELNGEPPRDRLECVG